MEWLITTDFFEKVQLQMVFLSANFWGQIHLIYCFEKQI